MLRVVEQHPAPSEERVRRFQERVNERRGKITEAGVREAGKSVIWQLWVHTYVCAVATANTIRYGRPRAEVPARSL